MGYTEDQAWLLSLPLDEAAPPIDELPEDDAAADEAWLMSLHLPDVEPLEEPDDDSPLDGWVDPRTIALSALSEQSRSGFQLLSHSARLDALIEVERQRAHLDGIAQQLLAGIAQHDETEDEWSREEVAAALRLAPLTAACRMKNATRLCQDLPTTLAALLDGRIAGMQAVAVIEASYRLPSELLPQLEERVLARADRQTLSETRETLKKAVLRLDADGAEQRHTVAHADRKVRAIAGEDGMGELVTALTAPDLSAISNLLDAAAEQQLIIDREAVAQAAHPNDGSSGAHCARSGATDEDLRTRDQVRADIVRDVLLDGLSELGAPIIAASRHDAHFAGDEPNSRDLHASKSLSNGRRSKPARDLKPTINVHVGLGTLVGTDDEPAWLDGYGPISAHMARDLAADQSGTWQRLIVDSATRRLLAFDETRYRPPDAFDRHIRRARVRCTFPGCARAATKCDLDHALAHDDGGLTCEQNIHPVCRRHHRLKHHPTDPWTPVLDTDGVTWTSPQGRTYRTDHLVCLAEPAMPDPTKALVGRQQSTSAPLRPSSTEDQPPF